MAANLSALAAGRTVMQRTERTTRAGRTTTALDLFSGCGGLSLGFRTAGFEILGGVELDPVAASTHGANFHPLSHLHGEACDIHQDPRRLLGSMGLDRTRAVNVLIGGPPCQAFARVGRAKLRECAGADDSGAWLNDRRADLYQRYLHYVTVLRPDAVLMENVPDVMNHGGANVAERICETLDAVGYESSYALLNAVHFGVPQMRLRLFLLAYRKDLGVGDIRWPDPTHAHDLPAGYKGTQACATRPLRTAQEDGVEPTAHRFHDYYPYARGRRQAVTVAQALADLPPIMARSLADTGVLRRGARSLADEVPYCRAARHAYARLMRGWPGFATDRTTTAHVIRYLPRDFRLFERLAAGDDYPRAQALSCELFAEHLRGIPVDQRPSEGSAQWVQLRATFVPPYDPTKFPNKWRKLAADEPSRTLMAHLGKDSYSHIHHDSRQGRTISVREAARLQSFPDGFRFCGSMNAGFRMIGNAVPPLLAYALARQMRTQLGLRQLPDIRQRFGLTPSVDRPPSVVLARGATG